MNVRMYATLYIVEFIEAYENQAQYEQTKTWLESQEFAAIAQNFADTTSWIYGNVLFVKK
jgi:hypothetical protein